MIASATPLGDNLGGRKCRGIESGTAAILREPAMPRIIDRKGAEKRTRARPTGFTLIELIAAIGILLVLTSLALPVAIKQVKRQKEVELRRNLRTLREAIDRYKDAADQGMIEVKEDSFGYPPDLETLVKGVETKSKGVKLKFLRRIPTDSITGERRWGRRGMQDPPDSSFWGGDNVFDVYSLSHEKALDGTRYSDW